MKITVETNHLSSFVCFALLCSFPRWKLMPSHHLLLNILNGPDWMFKSSVTMNFPSPISAAGYDICKNLKKRNTLTKGPGMLLGNKLATWLDIPTQGCVLKARCQENLVGYPRASEHSTALDATEAFAMVRARRSWATSLSKLDILSDAVASSPFRARDRASESNSAWL